MFRKRKARDWTAREGRSGERSPQVEAVWRGMWIGGTEESGQELEEHAWGWCWGCEGEKAFEVLSVAIRASVIFSALFKVRPFYKHIDYVLVPSMVLGVKVEGGIHKDEMMWSTRNLVRRRVWTQMPIRQAGGGERYRGNVTSSLPCKEAEHTSWVKKGQRTLEVQGKQRWL